MSRDSAYWKKSGLRAHLRQLRTEFGYTQEYVANESGYPLNQFRACENGIKAPSIDMLVAWCIVFNHRLCLMDFTERKNHKPHICPDLESHGETNDSRAADPQTPPAHQISPAAEEEDIGPFFAPV